MGCEPPEAPASPAELELLRKHRPLLQYSQDPFRICSARTAVDTEGNKLHRSDGSTVEAGAGLSLETLSSGGDAAEYLETTQYSEIEPPPLQNDPAYADRVYGRIVEDGRGGKWLQYWFWLYYNQKRLLELGSHAGDWEMVQIHLGRNDEPDRATFAQHEGGDARQWGRSMRLCDHEGRERIVVFVAPFSHASYYLPGTKFYIGGTDSPDELGPRVFPDVEPFGDWAAWPGRWGASTKTLGASPNGPACQNPKWSQPDHFNMRRTLLKPWQAALKGIWVTGHLTYPRCPTIEARIEGTTVKGTYEKGGLFRRGRHLYVSAHDPDDRTLVGGPIIVEQASGAGRFKLELRTPVDRCRVHAVAYNRFRQTSEPGSCDAVRSGG